MKPAIVISAHTMGLGVSRALGEQGVPVVMVHYDGRDMAHRSRHVVEALQAPHPEKGESEFIALLLRCADRYAGSALIPTSDEALNVVARHKASLSRHFAVCCPDWEITQNCLDKKRTYALAECHGIPAPKTRLPGSPAEATRDAAEIGFPLLVKPCESHSFFAFFGRKMFRVDSTAEMHEVLGRAGEAGLEVLLQEIIPGGDDQVVNYNAYAWEGESLVEFTAEHVRNAPPWFGSPRVALSREVPEIIKPGRGMLRTLNFSGYACTEFKRDSRDGVFKLMEVNARHNLSTSLAVRCGINFPWLEYRHRTTGTLPEPMPFRSGVYWVDLTRDLAYGIRYCLQERYSPAQYLRPYLQPHVFAIFDRHDPAPFRQRCRFLAGQAAQSIIQRFRSGGERRADNALSPHATTTPPGE